MAAGVVPQSFVQLQPHGAGAELFIKRFRQAGVALAEEPQVHGQPVGRLQHARDMPGAGGAGGGIGAGCRAGAAAQHGGDAGHQRFFHLLRADEVNVRIDTTGGEDLALPCNRLGAGADHDVDAGLGIRVAGLANGADAAVLYAHIGLDDAPVVDDQRVGDDRVDALAPGALALPHAVADHLAAAEFDFLPVRCVVRLDLYDEIGVPQAHPVARGGAEHVGIGAPRNRAHDEPSREPITRP